MRILLVTFLSLAACKVAAPAPQAQRTPPPWGEHASVVSAIESNRLDEAATALAKVPDTADVHFLRARLAEAHIDGETAYREIKQSVAAAPDFAEYQDQLGVIAGMPGGPGQSVASQAGRSAEAGRALDAALALSPNDPKYLYTRAYFLSLADKDSGGDPARGKKMFDRVLEVAPDSAWWRIACSSIARSQAENWNAAEAEAAKTGDRDSILGSRLFLLVGGTRLRDGKIDDAKKDLEAAAKLNVATANAFCDAGYALDGGWNPKLGHDFWARCLALLPDGPKAKDAKTRLDAEKGAAGLTNKIKIP